MPAHPLPITLTSIDYRVVAALSLLLSLWLIAIDPVLDRDAILYLRGADAYLQHGLQASLQLFGRPLLSICVALLHQLTGLPLIYAGLLLNSLFYALFCVGFVATVTTLGGDRRVQLLAAIVVLSHPTLNDQRSSILRDPAYWACLILAFRELLLYARRPLLRHQLCWSAYLLLATLFRFEGLFFAVLAPLSILATRDLHQRWRHCFRLLAPVLIAVGAALAVLALFPWGQASDAAAQGTARLSGIETYLDRMWALPATLSEHAVATGDAMLEFSATEDAWAAMLAGLGAILVLNICRALTWPWVLVMFLGTGKKYSARLRHDDSVLLWSHLLICFLYLAFFTLINRFMLERYATQWVIFALLLAPFILDRLWRTNRRSVHYLVVGLLVLMAGDSLHNRDYEKAFIRDASNWLLANTPAQASLASNNQHIAYFSRRKFNWNTATYNEFELQKILSHKEYWQDDDYLAMRVTRADEQFWKLFLQENSLVEAIVFEGGARGRVSIVRVPESAQTDSQ